ncbi:MAG: hypothetical protein NTX55_02795 [Candidatus Parcubacteria bacterium]|nr:hypothetical protein [Candidatus Parcubacteria bacterium]
MAIRVGVLRNDLSPEYEISRYLPEKYSGQDILLTPKGEWIFNNQFSYPEKIFRQIDVVFNTLYGCQKILEHFNIPYTGSGVFASALGMNKILSRDIFVKAGLNVPKAIIIDGEDADSGRKIFNLMSPPWVIGNFIIYKFDDLMKVLEFQEGPRIVVEEYIRGREAACGVIENFRGQEHYSLPVTEIISSREICPGNFDQETKNKIEEITRIAHQVLGCRHYSRQDFRISDRAGERGKIYILEANTLPGLTKESLVPKALETIGSSYSEFLDHLIGLALK